MDDTSTMAIEILQKTNDGNDLDPGHLYLVELAVNGFLSEKGETAFSNLHKQVTSSEGYKKPWFHGIENLTRDHAGYVYWKGVEVEHYDYFGKGAYEHESWAASDLADRCEFVEVMGFPVNIRTVIFEYDELFAGLRR
jgi:hypothetical protein